MRLIDADELKKHKYHSDITHENVVAVAQIDWMPTVCDIDDKFKQKAEVVISQLRADRDRLEKAIKDIREEIEYMRNKVKPLDDFSDRGMYADGKIAAYDYALAVIDKYK